MARSLICHINIWVDSGISETKSLNVSCAQAVCGMAVVGFGLDRLNQIRKLDGVRDKNDRHVVADQIPIAFVGIELDRKAAHVLGGIFRASLARHR